MEDKNQHPCPSERVGQGINCFYTYGFDGCRTSLSNGTSPADGKPSEWYEISNNGSLGDMTFCIPDYLKEAMKMMFMMRSHHMLTDVILEVGSELFHAHKVVLAAASPYFKVHFKKIWIGGLKLLTTSILLQAMFTGGLKECEMTRVKLLDVSPTAMARLMSFMYTGQIRVTEVTVCQLLPAATMFQVRTNISNFVIAVVNFRIKFQSLKKV